MNKRKALGATSSGAAQLAAPCAKQSRASSSSAFSACCTGNQGEPPQAVALSAVPQGSTVAAFENGGLFQPPAKKCNRTKEESQPRRAYTSTARRTSPGRGTTDTRCLVHDLDAQPTWLWFAVLCFAFPLASQRTWVPSHSRQRKRNPALFIADGIWQAPQINRIRWPILPL